MRVVKVPSPLQRDGAEPFTFADFLRFIVKHADGLNTPAGIRSAARIEGWCAWLEDNPRGPTVELADDDWSLLVAWCKDPGTPNGCYPFRPAHLLLPMIDAVENAEERCEP